MKHPKTRQRKKFEVLKSAQMIPFATLDECKPKQITDMAYSRNGEFLATCSYLGTICIYDTCTFQRLHKFESPFINAMVNNLHFSHDGKYLIVTSNGFDNIWVFCTSSFQILHKLDFDSLLDSFTLSPDGKYFATSHDDNSVRIWDAITFQEFTRLAFKDDEYERGGIIFSVSGKFAIYDSTHIKIYETHTFQVTHIIRASVMLAKFSPDGKYLVIMYHKNTTCVLKADTYEVVAQIPSLNYCTDFVTFSPDGKYMMRNGYNNSQGWDMQTFGELLVFRNKFRLPTFSPNGHFLAICSPENIEVFRFFAKEEFISFLFYKSKM